MASQEYWAKAQMTFAESAMKSFFLQQLEGKINGRRASLSVEGGKGTVGLMLLRCRGLGSSISTDVAPEKERTGSLTLPEV